VTYALLTEGMSDRERRQFDWKLRPREDAATPQRNDPADLDMLKRMMGAAGG
jgi:hypothetical protein